MHRVYTHTLTVHFSLVQNRQIVCVCVWHSFDANGEKQPFAQCLRWLVFSHESHKFRLYGILWRREKDCHRMQSERIAVRNVSIGISFSTFSTEILLVRLNASLLVRIFFFLSLISATCKRKFQINTQNTHTCTTDNKKTGKKKQRQQQNIESDKKMLYIRVMHKQNVLCSIEVGLRVSFAIDYYCFMCKMVISKQSRYWNI